MMTENLIVFSHLDKHPEENTFFADWLISEDIFIENVDSTYKIHRKLNVRQDVENPFDEFVSLIKKHHISPERMASLERKKEY